LFVILTLQSIFGRYGAELQSVWSWFLPNIVPNISLMIGVLGASALTSQRGREKTVRRSFFNVARALSLFYLLLLLLTILLEPLTGTPALDLYASSNYWLSPLQGITSGAIGILFVAQQSQGRAPEGRDP
jgi:hypothetical protein